MAPESPRTERAGEPRPSLFTGVALALAERFDAGPLYRLHYRLGLPWRCRLSGHTNPVYRATFIDEFYLDECWFECDRCGHWMGHA